MSYSSDGGAPFFGLQWSVKNDRSPLPQRISSPNDPELMQEERDQLDTRLASLASQSPK